MSCGSQTLTLIKDSTIQFKCECQVCGQAVVIDKNLYSTREFNKYYGYLIRQPIKQGIIGKENESV